MIAALLAVIVLTAAACGGAASSGSSPTSGPLASGALASPALSAEPSASEAAATPSAEPSVAPIPINPIPAAAFRAYPAAVALDSGLATTLQASLDNETRWSNLTGLEAAVVFADGRTWTGVTGKANLSTGDVVTDDTKFSVASISKTFVAALILKLAEHGTLSLDDPLSRFVPTYPNAQNITIGELLAHTSGLHDLFTSPGMSPAITNDRLRTWTSQDVLDSIGKPYFKPGAGYHYSNTNYVLLGQVVERVTGQKLGALLRQEFLDPLGMKNTVVQVDEPLTAPYAHGYTTTDDPTEIRDLSQGSSMIPFNSETTACSSSCEIASTATDLARWATALYGGGILDDSSLALMTDTSVTGRWRPTHPYGLGMEEWKIAGQVTWGHEGHLDGFWSIMVYLPKQRMAVVVTSNCEWANPPVIAEDLIRDLLG